MNQRAQLADALVGEMLSEPGVLRTVEMGHALARGQIGQLIDIVGPFGVAQEIVEKRPQPGVAGLRVGGEPNDASHRDSFTILAESFLKEPDASRYVAFLHQCDAKATSEGV